MLYQLELFNKSDEQMILETEQYFDYLENQSWMWVNGFQVIWNLSFSKPERMSDRLFVKV